MRDISEEDGFRAKIGAVTDRERRERDCHVFS